jgi:hypothetical protein
MVSLSPELGKLVSVLELSNKKEREAKAKIGGKKI